MKRLAILSVCVMVPLLVLALLSPLKIGTVQAAEVPYQAAPNRSEQAVRLVTPKPSATPKPTLRPTPTPKPTPKPAPTPTPTPTPKPSPTPLPLLTPPPIPVSDAPAATPASVPEERVLLADDEGTLPDREDVTAPPLPELPPPAEVAPEQADDLPNQEHYIPDNDARYRAYMAAYPQYSARMVVSLVNVDSDYGFYENVTQISDPSDVAVLCNKNHQLPKKYAPAGLQTLSGTSLKMRKEAADALAQMTDALKAELGLRLALVSAYRTFSYQQNLYSRYAKRDGEANADRYSARAGFSEHQTGLAIDFAQKLPTSGLRALHFEETEQYAWLLENAHRYGYILRYPDGFEQVTGYIYEPWHWRYIGVEHATAMFEGGYSVLEEYIGQL